MIMGLGIGVVVALLVIIVLLLIASQIRVDGPHSAVVMVILIVLGVGGLLWLMRS
jgi:hypothetical protein